MKRWIMIGVLAIMMMGILSACRNKTEVRNNEKESDTDGPYTEDTAIEDVIHDPVFGEYGRLNFPVEDGYYRGNTLGELQLTCIPILILPKQWKSQII